MYFKTYEPHSTEETITRAHAVKTYNAVCRFAKKKRPTADDYVDYIFDNRARVMQAMGNWDKLGKVKLEDVCELFCADLKRRWHAIKAIVSKAGDHTKLNGQYVVYFGILDNNTVKNGETNNLPARFSTLNGEGGIVKLWYLEVENKEQALAAEHALHMLFDHVRCMNRVQNKKDYYECKQDAAERYFKQNMKTIYDAIMAEI